MRVNGKDNGRKSCCIFLCSLGLVLFAGCSSSPQVSQLTRSGETLIGYVDAIAGVAVRDGRTAVSLAGKPTVPVVGWAIKDGKPGQKMMMSVNGSAVACEYGQPRADVAAVLQNDAFGNSGYTCEVPANTFSPGENTMEPRLTTGSGSYRAGQKVTVSVTP